MARRCSRTIPSAALPERAAPSLSRTRRASELKRCPAWIFPRHFKVRETATRFVQVALPLPLFQTFTYAIEDGLANPVKVGSRVVVPLRNDREVGICVGLSDISPVTKKPKAVIESPDAQPAIGTSLLELCRWMAEYYIVPLGVVLKTVLPAALTGAQTPTPARKTRRMVRL